MPTMIMMMKYLQLTVGEEVVRQLVYFGNPITVTSYINLPSVYMNK